MKTTTRILMIALALCVSGPAHAYRSTLPAKSLVCLSERQMAEAVKAVDRSDVEWLSTLTSCRVTKTAMEAQRLDCGMRTCKVRVFAPSGATVAYTFRNYLSD